MQTVLLTFVGPERSVDLRLPAEVPLADLLARLAELGAPQMWRATPFSPERWQVWTETGSVSLDMSRSLAEHTIVDGAILFLRDSRLPSQAQPIHKPTSQPFRPRAIQPSERTGGMGVRWHIPETEHQKA